MAMRRRQTVPRQWLVIADPTVDSAFATRGLPRGSGILLLCPVAGREMRRLRRWAAQRRLTIVLEGRRTATRVHGVRELRNALLARTPRILLSPIFPTRSHRDWRPVPKMRAAALARLAGRNLIALGGMNAQRYAHIARLGFSGWAGISAFRT